MNSSNAALFHVVRKGAWIFLGLDLVPLMFRARELAIPIAISVCVHVATLVVAYLPSSRTNFRAFRWAFLLCLVSLLAVTLLQALLAVELMGNPPLVISVYLGSFGVFLAIFTYQAIAARTQRRVYMRAWDIFTGAAPPDDRPIAGKQAQTALAVIGITASVLALMGNQSFTLSTLVVASSFLAPFVIVTIVECWQQMFVK